MHGMANIGNMASVYDEFWRMHDIAGEVETAINLLVASSAGTEAEISGDEPAYWFLVETFAGDDVKAMRWLARRKFGVFRPMQQRTDKRNDTKLQGWQPVFPGWLFVYTWDIDRMLRRILSLPGVMRVLSDPVSQSPVPIPAWFVDDLRNESFKYKDNAPHATYGRLYHEVERHVQRQKPRSIKLGNKERKKIDNLRKALKRSGKFDPSTWAAAAELAPAKRIALLQRSLNGPGDDGGVSLREETY